MFTKKRNCCGGAKGVIILMFMQRDIALGERGREVLERPGGQSHSRFHKKSCNVKWIAAQQTTTIKNRSYSSIAPGDLVGDAHSSPGQFFVRCSSAQESERERERKRRESKDNRCENADRCRYDPVSLEEKRATRAQLDTAILPSFSPILATFVSSSPS